MCAQFEHVVILGSSLCDFGSTGKSARAQLKILRARVKLARAVRARAQAARVGVLLITVLFDFSKFLLFNTCGMLLLF